MTCLQHLDLFCTGMMVFGAGVLLLCSAHLLKSTQLFRRRMRESRWGVRL
jgi:hypothetical protein